MKKRIVTLCALMALASLVAFAADVTGKWVGDAAAGGKGGPPTFNFKQTGTALTGIQEGGRGPTDITNGKVDGDTVTFEVTRDMGDKGKFTTTYKGSVSGATMKLQMDNGRGTPREIVLTKQ